MTSSVARWGRACLVILLLVLALPSRAAAQSDVRPGLDWQTIRTRYFDIHYPSAAEQWTRDVASRLDAVRDSVASLVGHAPAQRVTVLVEDPSNTSNGFALPFLRQPVIVLWPTPVAPPHVLAGNRGWGDLLAVHEYAHISHLTRPSRNRFQRLLWSMLPVELGPVTRRSPRWLIEGYATVVEGVLTGSGRPNAPWRAAMLRQWALEGMLPAYDDLDDPGGFQGGAMAYVVGSAFLEWLDEQALSRPDLHGPLRPGESHVRLWRRMSAVHDRGFEEAFRGTYGLGPEQAYGRFVAGLTGSALAVQRELHDSGAPEGSLVQRLARGTGDPTVSPDGTRLAMVRQAPNRPPRVVVIDIGPGADTAAERRVAELRERILERDPEDVPAVRPYPLPRTALATLPAMDGRAPSRPRFMPDGGSILFIRAEPAGDGSLRNDLFEWSWEAGGTRRITHLAGIREAFPTPDGSTAIGVRCTWGVCDLVRIELASGAIRVLRNGAPDVQYAGARVAADGRIAVAEQREGHWRVLLLDARGTPAAGVQPPDDAPRYSPSFSSDGGSLVVTSERGGIPHLERIDLATGHIDALTRPVGAHFSPDAAPDGRVFFLSLHAGGYDLREVRLDSVMDPARFGPSFGAAFGGQDSLLVPAVAPRVGRPVVFHPAPVPSAPYRTTLRAPMVLPGGGYAADGGTFSLMAASSDPVGRLSWLAEAGFGDRSAWRGGNLAAAYRRWPVHIEGSAGAARSRPSFQRRAVATATAAGALDAGLVSATLAASISRSYGLDGYSLRAGVSHGRLTHLPTGEGHARSLAFITASARIAKARDTRIAFLDAAAHGAAGRTAGDDWNRAAFSTRLGAGNSLLGAMAEGTIGYAGSGTPLWEQFSVGGAQPRFVAQDAIRQRIAIQGLPAGTLTGDRLLLWRVTARLPIPVPLQPYLTSISTDRDFANWQRLAGLELRASFDAVPFVRLPAVAIEAGWARRLTWPGKGDDELHATIRFHP